MAKLHSKLMKEVKEYLENKGWSVIEIKKGKQSKYYNTGRKGISDLLAVRNHDYVCWIEIKTKNDIQKPDQIKFQADVEKRGELYFLIYDLAQVMVIFND